MDNIDYQVVFNIILLAIIFFALMTVSLGYKMGQTKGNEKEAQRVFSETIGAGIMIFFLIFTIYATCQWGSY